MTLKYRIQRILIKPKVIIKIALDIAGIIIFIIMRWEEVKNLTEGELMWILGNRKKKM